jgi:hypothetical protein
MNTPSSDELDRRLARLTQRSARLRNDVAQHVQVLRQPLAYADKARDAVDWLVLNPQWPMAALTVIALLRPRRALRWAGTLWWGWGLFKRTRRMLERL